MNKAASKKALVKTIKVYLTVIMLLPFAFSTFATIRAQIIKPEGMGLYNPSPLRGSFVCLYGGSKQGTGNYCDIKEFIESTLFGYILAYIFSPFLLMAPQFRVALGVITLLLPIIFFFNYYRIKKKEGTV